MLREGWDVRNVVVIVPLRPYTAKAQILPEQTLGRGLRRMDLPASGHDKTVIVIEHEAFWPFWKKELEEEGYEPERMPVDVVRPNFRPVYVDKTKLHYDIEVPLLTPALIMATQQLENFTAADIGPRQPLSPPQPCLIQEDTIDYRGIEMLTLREVERQEIERDFPADPVGYVSVMCHLTGQFHRLAGLVKDYIENVLFGVPISMEEDYVLIRLNRPDAKARIFDAFVEAIRERTVEPQVVRPTGEVQRFSSSPGYEWSWPFYPGLKTVFNLVACDNQFETEFAAFLDGATDVAAYVKNNLNTYFKMDYQNSEGAIRNYYPDFVLRLVSGDMWLVETKGVEDADVARKDARAEQWCWDASAVSGVHWEYLKVPYGVFQDSSATTFSELAAEIRARLMHLS